MCLRRIFLTLAIVFFTSSACSGDSDSTSNTDSTGSQGAATSPAGEGALQFEAIETLRIGEPSVPGAYEIGRLEDIAVADNGDIYLMDASKPEVAVFDSSGALLRRIGRGGQGPGEFGRSLGFKLAISDDTLFAMSDKLIAFTLSGDPHYTRDALPATGNMRRAVQQLVFTPHNLIMMQSHSPRGRIAVGATSVDTLRIKWRDPTTGVFDPEGVAFRGMESIFAGDGAYTMRMFGGVPSVAIAPSGRIIYTTGSEYRIDVHMPEGSLERTIASDVSLVPIVKADIDGRIRVAEERMALMDDMSPERAEMFVEAIRSSPRSDFRPVIGTMLVGTGDTLLLHRVDLDDQNAFPLSQGSIWDVVTIEGKQVGQLSLPKLSEYARLLEYRDGSIYVAEMNADDAPILVRYTIRARQR